MAILELADSISGEDGSTSSGPAVDIVAVHGLHEDAHGTWTEPANGTLWLRDLFPHQAQNARIIAYSYPSQKLTSSDEGNANQVLPHATNLVAELCAHRSYSNGDARPIIFVCHGFGGLLVKRALVYAAKSQSRGTEHLRSVYISTYAILFFGCPHHGYDETFLLATQNLTTNVNRPFWNELSKDSAFLNEITDQFSVHRERFVIYNFWEQAMTTLGNIKTLVVQKDSAAPVWEDVERYGILTTHSEMVKFKDKDDRVYRVVLAALLRYRKEAPSKIETRWKNEIEQRGAQRKQEVYEQLIHFHRGLPQVSIDCGASNHQEYHIPRASSNQFIGRQSYLKSVKTFFGLIDRGPTLHRPKVMVICGLGGSGKTQLALNYAEDSRSTYWGIFWVDATSTNTLETGFASLGMMAGKGATPSSAIHWLSTCLKPWLLIFDNADDPELDLSNYFPPGGNGHVMITTRNPEANAYATVGSVKLSGMDPEEAISLLLRSAYPEPDMESQNPEKRSVAHAIAQRLGYLAIALAHAGATIRRKIYTLEVYLHHYLGHRRVVLNSHSAYSAMHADTITTWEIPFQRIAGRQSVEHRDAVDLVHLFAFMHFQSIPEKIFRRSWHGLSSVASDLKTLAPLLDRDGRWDEDTQARFRRAVRILYEHSIIDHDPDNETCSLHPVVHRWAQERMHGPDQSRWLTFTMTILAHCISPHLEASGRRFRTQLMPHIEACLGELRLRCRKLPDTLSRATQMERFASVYAENGMWNQAKALQQDIVDFRRKKLGKRQEDTLRAQRSLGHTLWNLFEIKAAGEAQRDVLLTRLWLRPSLVYWAVWPPWKPDHIEYCLILDDLTLTLWLAGRRDWSKRVGERAVRGLTKRLGADDPQTLNAVFNLARTYLHLGDQQLSHRLLVKVLLKRKRLFGMNHPDTLMTRNELGMNLCAQRKRLAVAESLVANVLEARKRILGEEHAYTLWSINDLSKVLCERKRPQQAAAMLEEILPVVTRTLSDKHVGMTMTRGNLARAYVLCERWAEAEALLSGLLESVPEDHPDSINTRSGLVHVRIRMGKLAEAEEDCARLLAVVRRKRDPILAPDSSRAIAIHEQMLEIYRLQNRPAELETLSREMPALNVPSLRKRFDMLPIQRILRRESELDRLHEQWA